MPGDVGGRMVQVGPGDGSVDVDLVLKSANMAVSINAMVLCIANLVPKSEYGVIEVTDLRLQEKELL